MDKDLVVAEYNGLRAELQTRIGIRYQMIQFAFIGLGSLLTVGFTTHFTDIIFVYPILALVLTLIYITNAYECRRMALYIREKIESQMWESQTKDGFGWQHFRIGDGAEQYGSLGNIGAKAVFIITSLFVVIIGFPLQIGVVYHVLSILIFLGITCLAIVEHRYYPYEKAHHSSTPPDLLK
jgi:Na+-transporting methylmalonyl-CoA/oxaloacetate decarboxylase gamma subunit